MNYIALTLIAACLAGAASSPSADKANAWMLGEVGAFRQRADVWRRSLAAGSGAFPTIRLRAELDTLRRAYKRIEPAVETLHPECLELFNAPPVDRVDEDEPFKIEIEHPQGLQVLEEEIYREDASPDRARVALLLAQLCGAADELASQLRFAPPDDARWWEAAENEVIRIMAMGLTGFDTPASGKGLLESGAALRSLGDFAACYRGRIPSHSAGLAKLILAASRPLEAATDFDGFDRLEYLRSYGNPLHAAFTDARRALGLGRVGSLPGVTRADRAQPIPGRAVSARARGLFDPAFLDREFFALDYDGLHRETPTAAGVGLGKRLFFDPILSGDNRRACASCHRPGNAYAEPLERSAGFRSPDGDSLPRTTGDRNAPSLVYAAYQRAQFWDLRATLLEDQIGHVVNGRQEFNTTFAGIQAKVRAVPAYVRAFAKAFPRAAADPVTDATLVSALAQYVRSLPGWNSPVDRYLRGERNTLDPAAKRGFNLFMGKAGCGTCHFPPAFSGTVPPLYRETEAEVLGVPASADTLAPGLDTDPGRYRVRPAALWRGAFKTPTVRNAALTAPYMHNGQLPTLESVVRFYAVGGGAGMGFKVPNQTLPSDSLRLSSSERGDLVAFLKALTDDPLKADAPPPLPPVPQRPELASRPPGGEY